MMKFAALAWMLALPAAAQDRAAEIDWENARQDALKAEQALKRAADQAAVDRALTAMNDGGSDQLGPVVFDRLTRDGIAVVMRAGQAKDASILVENGKTVIVLSDALPRYPRVLAPLIALQVASRLFTDMPACAERGYMRLAAVARVWIELGGDPRRLPVVEPLTGARNQAISDAVALWAKGAQWGLSEVARTDNLRELPDLISSASDAERPALEAANKRFTEFLWNERFVRSSLP